MKKIFLVVVILIIIFKCFCFLPHNDLLEGTSYSKMILDNDDNLLRLTLSNDDKYRLKINYYEIPDNLIKALLLYEDRYFYWHPGINPISILRAAWSNFFNNTRYAASTITMQLARKVYKIDSSSFSGKLEQILRSFWLELKYSKQEILESYFCIAPYGGNIEGIKAAALIYYRKYLTDLSLLEIFSLVPIPQNPAIRALNGINKKDSQNNLARKTLLKIWEKKYNKQDKFQITINDNFYNYQISDLPFKAPHFVQRVLKLNPYDDILHTTLNWKMQKSLRNSIKNYVQSKKTLGVKNAFSLVLNFKRMEVVAYVGSANFFDNEIHGQVNGVNSKRSPGSTLKPFLYGMALDQGLIHSHTLLSDSPDITGAFNPQNFDKDYKGPLFAKDALINSRNVPAVKIAMELHPEFYFKLKNIGISGLKSKEHYGHSLVLGTAELTMEELAKMYAALANLGKYQKINFFKQRNKNRSNSIELISPESSWIIKEILKDQERPGISYNKFRKREFEIAWKTGTSFGFRDAWTAGIVGDLVIVVWLGNFDGTPNPQFFGRGLAAPLFFNIINSFKAKKLLGNGSYREIVNVREVEVCSVSGGIPNEFCPVHRKAFFIPGISPIKKCNIHRQIYINPKTKLRACKNFESANIKTYEFWPSDLAKLFSLAGIFLKKPPEFDKECEIGSFTDLNGMHPTIISPKSSIEYQFRSKDFKKREIEFRALGDADVKKFYWFVNKKYIGYSLQEESIYWKMEPGKHFVHVVDNYGRGDRKFISVNVLD